ncbi:DUF6223 family protein [Nonomuraea sp. NPDC047897]|uniref:DUF6223 family protein n=1 Tax=Nonomuraea sp. NPDC047897 TaxID=3364346 RepID=UPI00371FDAF7
MSIRHLLATAATAATAPLAIVGLATPAAAHVLVQPVDAYTLTSGRLWSAVAALLGLTGIVIGGLALARSARRTGTGTGTGRRGAIVTLATGLTCTLIGALVVAAADGGPGTGYGIVGGYVDLAVGLIATVLGGLALARSRRTA